MASQRTDTDGISAGFQQAGDPTMTKIDKGELVINLLRQPAKTAVNRVWRPWSPASVSINGTGGKLLCPSLSDFFGNGRQVDNTNSLLALRFLLGKLPLHA